MLTPSLKRVADYIDTHRLDVMALSAIEIAKAVGTSDATVVRAVQALGFEGLDELRRELAHSYRGRNAPSDNLARTLADVGENTERAVDAAYDASIGSIEVLALPEQREAITEALRVLHIAKRIVIFGLGPTAHIAAYAATRLRREGRRAGVVDRGGEQIADQLLQFEAGDAVIMMAYGSIYREAEATIAEARRLKIPIVLLSDTSDDAFLRHARVVLNVPRGRSQRIALHGATIVCIEMLLLGLATSGRELATSSLERLERLRETARSRRPR
ncbi:MurR/RpiR family transcriptional regulator [Variibacter gotjawalensis]|uniref:MurR/RpiR family transcriptional regulator n=1 Tax=Variibacter gotjawalensis TaxID=1333996 RepID=UPI0013EE46F4|nr:MurR/RpiR family transcriptional regulator [Variibacter gotjawalensis]NIK46362.1 DNA-binding MurR/RpiR family transcriptional regulator [Variibacter gotjawalensis]